MKTSCIAAGILFGLASLCSCQAGSITLAGKSVTVTVPVPRSATARNMALRVGGIVASREQGAILRVFAGMPEANRSTSVDDERFVGYVTVLAGGGRNKAGSSAILNLPPHAGKWLKNTLALNQALRITLVPMNDGEIHIGSVQLVPVQ